MEGEREKGRETEGEREGVRGREREEERKGGRGREREREREGGRQRETEGGGERGRERRERNQLNHPSPIIGIENVHTHVHTQNRQCTCIYTFLVSKTAILSI